MRHRSWIVAITLTLALAIPTVLHASININVEAVSKSVVFLYGTDSHGEVAPLGTGFLVGVPLVSNPKLGYTLLVTARHIVDPRWAHCQSPSPETIYARFNKKKFDSAQDAVGTGDLPITLVKDGKPTWWSSSDDQVDAAVIPLEPASLSDFDYIPIPVSVFPTEDEIKKFATGDDIVSAGLMLGASGKRRNYPVFKFGNISNIPDDPVDTNCGPASGGSSYTEKVWVIAASLVPGNSGSPLFYVPAGGGGVILGGNGLARPILIGVQSMSFLPWDVAGMTPIKYVYEMIRQNTLDADLRRGDPPK